MRTRYGPSVAQVVGETGRGRLGAAGTARQGEPGTQPVQTRATGHDAGSHVRTLRFLVPLLLAAAFVQACGIGGGGSSELAGLLALIPAAAEDVTVYDFEQIRREEAPRALRDEVEFYVSEYGLEEMGVLTDELTTLVVAFGDGWYLLAVEGDIDPVHVTDRLEDSEYDYNQYRGFELWEGGAWPYESVALFEDRGRMVIGDTEAVKRVLRMLDRGSGSLLDDADSDLGRVLKRAGAGWISGAQEQCPGYEVRGCRALGVSLRKGDDDYLVEITVAVLFRDERTAESEVDELESQIEEDSSFEFDIDDVQRDGDFVIVTGSGDKDDLFEGESAVPVTPTATEARDAPATRDDHGDTADEATLVRVGDAVAGVLGHRGDIDYFAFAAKRGETYRIDVDLGTLDDSVAALFDSDSRQLEFDDDGGESLGSRIIWTAAESGTYYVAVAGWGSDTGSYTLTITPTASGNAPDEAEAADEADGAGGGPPDSPANQRYEYDGGAVVLTWDAVSGADSYTVYYDDFFDSACSVRSGGPSFCEELATDLTGTTYTHADPDARENYYWVVACNNYGCSAVESDSPARAAP